MVVIAAEIKSSAIRMLPLGVPPRTRGATLRRSRCKTEKNWYYKLVARTNDEKGEEVAGSTRTYRLDRKRLD
jgi:hypothetical protein